MKAVAECTDQVRFQIRNMLQVSTPTHRPQDGTKQLFPDLRCEAFIVRNTNYTSVRKCVGPCDPRSVQETLMTLGALPNCTVCASNHPLGAKFSALQRNIPEFTRIDEDEADCREVLTRPDKQSRAAAKKYFDAFVPWTVP